MTTKVLPSSKKVTNALSQGIKKQGGELGDLDLLAEPVGEPFLELICSRLTEFGKIWKRKFQIPVDYELMDQYEEEWKKLSSSTGSKVRELLEFRKPRHAYLSQAGQERIPLELVKKQIIIPVVFAKEMKKEEIVSYFQRYALRPIIWLELFAIDKHMPTLQAERPVVCLGSEWENRSGNDRSFVGLESIAGTPTVIDYPQDEPFLPGYCFPALPLERSGS